MAPDVLRHEIEAQKKRIVERVRQGPCPGSLFKKQWVSQPSDPFSEGDYGQMLLELEEAGHLLVYDKQNRHPAPASACTVSAVTT